MKKAALTNCGETKIVVFEHIAVPHGCSTRIGGVSSGHLDSFNTGFTVGDDPAKVWENRRRFGEHFCVENFPWLLSMTHGKEVAVVTTAPPLPSQYTERSTTTYSADAAITNVKGVPLSLTIADCVPVFLYDPVKKAIGIAHAGWRGTVAGIVGETVRAMVENYGSSPEDIQLGIGPSIGPDKFEVGPEVIEEFAAAFPDDGRVILEHPDSSERAKGKGFVNLWEANSQVAKSAGIKEENLQVSGWCTASNPELFFSHRRDDGKSGRLLAAICL